MNILQKLKFNLVQYYDFLGMQLIFNKKDSIINHVKEE